MCFYPTLRVNKKYTNTKKNGGVIPAVTDKRALYVATGCGRCMECMKQKARDWQVRLLEEIRHSKNGVFVTLTFSNESIWELSQEIKGVDGYERDNAIAKLGVRRFLERWRKKYKKSVRHWLVTELGHQGTENIHLHGIIWTDESAKEIDRIWKYGYTWIGDEEKGGWVNEQTVNYIVKYIHKTDIQHKEYRARVLTTPGIGKAYVKRKDAKANKYKKGETNEAYITRQGFKMALPIYYRNQIYSEEEREKLWMEKLDKGERWVDGAMTKDEDAYWRMLKEARSKNKRLGYGNNERDWDRKKYENDRRNMMHNERVKMKKEQATDKMWEALNELHKPKKRPMKRKNN